MAEKPVVFVHAGMRAYRNRLFDLLSTHLDIRFKFYLGKKRIYQFRDEWEEASKNWKYEILRPFRNAGYSYLAPSVMWKVWDSSIIITSDLSSFATHSLYALTRVRRRPLIVWGENWEWPETLSAKIILPYVRRIVRGCDALIAAGTKAREFFIRLGADPEKVFIAPDAAERLRDPPKSAVRDLRKRFGVKNKKVVLYLARIVSYKGLEYLLRAAKKLEDRDDIVFVIAGSGEEYETYCRGLAKKLGLRNVVWAGYAQHDLVAAYYDLSDVYVLPSVFRKQDAVSSEAWGLSVNEALSRHTPVVATTAVASAFDLIQDRKNGFLVRPEDSGALASAILSSLELDKRVVATSCEEALSRFTYEKQFEGFMNAVDYVKKNREETT